MISLFLDNVRLTSCDNSRTPFQWNDGPNAGFTRGKPWFHINPNYVQINAERESAQGDSVLNYYKKMIQLRHKIPALVYGAYQDLNAQDNTVYAYTRILGRERYLVVVNFKEQPVRYLLPSSDAIEQVVIETNQHNDTPQGSTSIALSPWQAGVYKLH